MLKKRKLRKKYDQKLLQLMESTQSDWVYLEKLEDLSYEKGDDLQVIRLLAKSKYLFLLKEARVRKASIK